MAKLFLNGRHMYGEPIALAVRQDGAVLQDDIHLEVAPGGTVFGLTYDEVYETLRWKGWVATSDSSADGLPR